LRWARFAATSRWMAVPSSMLPIAMLSLLSASIACVNRAPCLPQPTATPGRAKLKRALVTCAVTVLSRTGIWPGRSSTRRSTKRSAGKTVSIQAPRHHVGYTLTSACSGALSDCEGPYYFLNWFCVCVCHVWSSDCLDRHFVSSPLRRENLSSATSAHFSCQPPSWCSLLPP